MQFCLPDLGEGIVEAELVEWLVQPGATVTHGQNMAEVLTDKATIELPAPFSGTITRLRVAPHEQIKVGEAMLDYETSDDADLAATRPAPAAPADAPAAPADADVVSGDAVPAASAAAAPAISAAAQRLVGPGAAVRPSAEAPQTPAGAVRAAPSVRRMAKQLGVDLAQLHPTGPSHRVLMDDLAAFVKQRQRVDAADGKSSRPEPSPANQFQPGRRIKLHGLRRTIAERMVHAKHTVPHYSYVDECDVSELVRIRTSLKDHFAADGIRLTYLPFFVKAVVGALQDVPLANASLDEQTNEIVLHDRYHIGIATDTPGGLLVPVLRDADRADLPQLAREIQRLTESARAGKATRDELRGSTFTITSLGGAGGLISTPIINEPEVGILGIGRIVRRPMFDATDRIRAADMVYLSFSFDHRVMDGAVAAQLSNAMIARLRNPALLLLPSSSA